MNVVDLVVSQSLVEQAWIYSREAWAKDPYAAPPQAVTCLPNLRSFATLAWSSEAVERQSLVKEQNVVVHCFGCAISPRSKVGMRGTTAGLD